MQCVEKCVVVAVIVGDGGAVVAVPIGGAWCIV